MTRKDYVAIAAALNATRYVKGVYPDSSEYSRGIDVACSEIAGRLADVMGRDNARFDRARFLRACGVQS